MPHGQARLYFAAALLLVAGLASALTIYVVAEDEPENVAIYRMNVSKPYVRELERYGGKYAVLSDEFFRWFETLWQGKTLGVTIGWISVAVSLSVFLAGRVHGPDSAP